jgi:antitoxin component YwqK of YwqJK toxin-antitoxin module
MKNTILILISLLFLTGVSEGKEVNYLQDRNGIMYEVNTDVGFTGKYVEYYKNGHGQKMYEKNYKDGELEGLRTEWFENGQKRIEGNYKGGKREGLETWWYENGQKKWERNFKNNKEVGLWTW